MVFRTRSASCVEIIGYMLHGAKNALAGNRKLVLVCMLGIVVSSLVLIANSSYTHRLYIQGVHKVLIQFKNFVMKSVLNIS